MDGRLLRISLTQEREERQRESVRVKCLRSCIHLLCWCNLAKIGSIGEDGSSVWRLAASPFSILFDSGLFIVNCSTYSTHSTLVTLGLVAEPKASPCCAEIQSVPLLALSFCFPPANIWQILYTNCALTPLSLSLSLSPV